MYHDLLSYQPELASETKEAEGTLVMEPISLPSTSVGEMPVVSLTMPILTTTELKVIISPTSLTLVVETALTEIVTSPTSIVASVLVSMRTPPRSPTLPHIALASASAIPSIVMSVKLVKTLPSGPLIHRE